MWYLNRVTLNMKRQMLLTINTAIDWAQDRTKTKGNCCEFTGTGNQ